VTGIDPTIRDPRVHRVNATIEQSLDSATTISASFVGTYGRRLFGSEEVNGGAQTPLAARPDPRFTVQRLIGNTSSSDYNSLQIFANRRIAGRVDLHGRLHLRGLQGRQLLGGVRHLHRSGQSHRRSRARLPGRRLGAAATLG
jgi:hypothetical protein